MIFFVSLAMPPDKNQFKVKTYDEKQFVSMLSNNERGICDSDLQ